MADKDKREAPLADDREAVAESDEQRDQRKAEKAEVEWRHQAQGLNKDGTKKKSS